jgi:hypothetical protein
MNRKLFWFGFWLILISSFILHSIAVSGNNYHFTVDQGNDAVQVRDLIAHPKLIFRGPETSIRGVYAGPLWYYFIAIGSIITNGNPIGPVYLMIFLNLLAAAIVMLFLRKRIGDGGALLVGFARQTSWYFFETALWTFNPFPLVLLGALLVISLTLFIEGKKKYYYLALFVTLLSFNTDLAGAAVFLIVFIGAGLYGLWKKTISVKMFVLSAGVLPTLAVIAVLYDFVRVFQEGLLHHSSGQGLQVFSGTNFTKITIIFSELASRVVFPRSFHIGIFLFALIAFLYFAKYQKNPKTKIIIRIILLMFLASYLFFSSNKGYRSWHIVFHPTMLFTSVILMLLDFPKYLKIGFITIILGANIFNFYVRFTNHMDHSNDASMLYNEMSAIDWIYTHNDNDGFNVYTYTNTFYDYPYQYLLWWYGKGKYGFMPCEYSNYPLSHKETYVPNYLEYSEPKLGCNRLRFLIIQSDTNGQSNADWIDEFKKETTLLDQTQIGRITVEKREVKN